MIAWVDTETSGLDANHDSLLEFVLVMTDDHLSEIDQFGPFAIEPSILGRSINDWDEVVIDMHTHNGLLDEILNGKPITPEQLDDNLYDYLHIKYQELEKQIPLAGSTIGFDRAFMKRWLPRSERFFHYRSIDISSVKELTRRWNKTVFDLRPQVPDEDKEHRALPDIRASIEEACWYRDKLFQVNLPPVPSPYKDERPL